MIESLKKDRFLPVFLIGIGSVWEVWRITCVASPQWGIVVKAMALRDNDMKNLSPRCSS